MSASKSPGVHRHGSIVDGEVLQIYIDEAAKIDYVPLHSWIIREAHKRNLAAAYVFRANEGFGISRNIQTTSIVDLSYNLPVLVTVIDTREQISEFRSFIEKKIRQGIIISSRATLQIQNQPDK